MIEIMTRNWSLRFPSLHHDRSTQLAHDTGAFRSVASRRTARTA